MYSRNTPPFTARGSPIRSKFVFVSQPVAGESLAALFGRHRGVGAFVRVRRNTGRRSCRPTPRGAGAAGVPAGACVSDWFVRRRHTRRPCTP